MKTTVDLREIENLILLLDAESTSVRENVRHELEEKVVELGLYLRENNPRCTPRAQYILHELVRANRHQKIRGSWLDWLDIDDEYKRMEAAFSYLSVIDDLEKPPPPLVHLLDQTLNRFLDSGGKPGVIALSRYLFRKNRLSGVEENYYHPNHSNLCWVLMEGKGLPISLTVILMLCGARLGLQIQGFNWPGHFMARAVIDGKPILIDCFNKGKVLKPREVELISMSTRIDIGHLVRHPPTTITIVNRVLNNLINAHHRAGNFDQHQLYNDLKADLKKAVGPAQGTRDSEREPRFAQGELVRHKHYGYRGVVVSRDTTCQADDLWYRGNKTQPDMDQPWYHVLVDDSNVTTYAAQVNLTRDESALEITHPWISVYFEKFEDGRYTRNQVPWNPFE